ncbi:hypothetical protein ACO1O0_008697 [Amphichorda felina]
MAVPDETLPSCPIKHIPLELLLRITYWLPTPDLGSMRLTCRAIEKMLYHSFAEEFFSRKQFMLSQFSVQALINISKSRMGGHIRRLQFGTDMMAGYPGYGQPTILTAEAYSSECEFLNTSLHRDMLAEALRNLTNLEDVVIRDFNSTRRSRDGPAAQWRSYGSSTARRELGFTLQMNQQLFSTTPLHHFPARVFMSLLDALGASEARPTGIEIMTRFGSNLADFAFSLNPSLRPSVVSMLNRLEKLHLSINFGWTDGESFDPASIQNHMQSKSLARFLGHTHDLKNLRINEVGKFNGGLESFLMWLAQPAPLDPKTPHDQDWPAPVALPRLEELSIGHMSTQDTVLLDIIKKFAPSLKSLELWRVCLVWSRPLHLDGHDGNIYKRFLSHLVEIPELDLRHFQAGNIEEKVHEKGTDRVPFDKRRVSFKDTGSNSAYTGSDWKHFVQEMISTLTSTKVPDPNHREDPGQDEDTNNDESSDSDASDEENSVGDMDGS